MSDKLMESFAASTEKKLMKSGRVEIHCKKGLWAVDAPTEEQAMHEALHYFSQYYADGEYDK